MTHEVEEDITFEPLVLPVIDEGRPDPAIRGSHVAALQKELERWLAITRREEENGRATFQEQFQRLCEVGVYVSVQLCMYICVKRMDFL